MATVRSFIIRGAAFLLLIAGLLYAVNVLTDAGLRRSGHDDYLVWNELFTGRAAADIVVNGNSHAASQIDSRILARTLGGRAYNIGLDGQDLDLQLMRYNVYCQYNKKPRIIIQVVDFNSLQGSTRLLNRQQYLPYLAEDILYRKVHPLGISFWDRYFPLLKYRGLLPVIKTGFREYFHWNSLRSPRVQGFLARNDAWDSAADTFIRREPYHFLILGYTPSVADTARQFLRRAQQEGIRTIIVAAPQFHEYSAHFPNRQFYWRAIAVEAKKYGAFFLNFEEDTMCYDRANFRNATHLNAQGAGLFSQKLADAVKALPAVQ